jgi:hypothetical protein
MTKIEDGFGHEWAIVHPGHCHTCHGWGITEDGSKCPDCLGKQKCPWCGEPLTADRTCRCQWDEEENGMPGHRPGMQWWELQAPTHTDACLAAQVERSLTRRIWAALHPGYCRTCHGWGEKQGVPCPVCAGRCPWCGKALDQGTACSHCDWQAGAAGMSPKITECGCHILLPLDTDGANRQTGIPQLRACPECGRDSIFYSYGGNIVVQSGSEWLDVKTCIPVEESWEGAPGYFWECSHCGFMDAEPVTY